MKFLHLISFLSFVLLNLVNMQEFKCLSLYPLPTKHIHLLSTQTASALLFSPPLPPLCYCQETSSMCESPS